MSKGIKLVIIGMILLLASCARPQPQSTSPLPDTEIPPTETAATPQPQASATEAPLPSNTPQPTQTVAEPTPAPPPTQDVNDLLVGDPIPLLPASSEFYLRGIQMITSQSGWGVSRVEDQADHILITSTGGRTWQDVTPPQPLPESGAFLAVTSGFADEDTAFVHYTGTELVWTTYNGGTTWQPSALSYQSMMGGMFAVADQENAWLFQFLDGGMQKVYTSLARTSDGGRTWETILDPYSEAAIQGFDKTGAAFLNSQYGWLTRDFRGVATYLYLDITRDGGVTWEQLEMPAPPTDEDAFSTCACGLYDPNLVSPQRGSARLTCKCFEGDTTIIKNYLYKTTDGGDSWTINYVPAGTLYTVIDQARYLASRDIYRTTDGGEEWDLVKSVNWDGQFSFIDLELAWAVAYDPVDDEYALVKTTDGCITFQIIEPQLLPSGSVR